MIYMKDPSIERMCRMDNGERIPCPICKMGHWRRISPKGSAPSYGCDYCGKGMSPRVFSITDIINNAS